MSRLDLISSNSNNSKGKEKIHKKFTPYLFSNQLKDLGFVVVPFTNNHMVWSVQNMLREKKLPLKVMNFVFVSIFLLR